MRRRKVKYYLTIQTETDQWFLSDTDEYPDWRRIKELGSRLPMLYPTLTKANDVMRSLVKPFAPVITEVKTWGTEE